MKRLVIYDQPGQTCNRFWSYLDAVSWAVLNKKRVYILFWDRSIEYYDALRKSRYVSFPLYSRLAMRLFGKERWKRKMEKVFGSEKAIAFYERHSGNGRVRFMRGWPNREGNTFFPLVQDEVVKMFLPNKMFVDRIDKLFVTSRNHTNVIVVGVHIRRGDYKEWKDGRYYYEDEIYDRFMDRIECLFKEKTVKFYIASNEPIPDYLRGRHDVFSGYGTAPDDLYALSQCDFIIGPPSTFSKWASLMGHVPYHIIYDRDEVISTVDDFSPLKSHTQFENGVQIW